MNEGRIGKREGKSRRRGESTNQEAAARHDAPVSSGEGEKIRAAALIADQTRYSRLMPRCGRPIISEQGFFLPDFRAIAPDSGSPTRHRKIELESLSRRRRHHRRRPSPLLVVRMVTVIDNRATGYNRARLIG